jgi:uncharacterized protein
MTMDIIEVDARRAWAPRITDTTKPFWSALAHGHMTTTQCARCSRYTFPPKPICPHCWSSDLAWSELSGHGVLYSRTVIHAPPKVFDGLGPLHVGIVDLVEGVRICCGLIEDDGPIPLDSRVELVTLRYADGPLFCARRKDAALEPRIAQQNAA